MSVARLLVLAGASALAACSTPTSAAAPGGPAAAPGDVRYLAFGDSFTIGTGAAPALSFPARLAARCRAPVALRNLGVNGYTSEDVLERELPEVAAYAPGYVTLAAGANDIVHGETPATYRAHVHALLAALRDARVPRVVTIPQPDWSRSPVAAAFGRPDALHARIVEANAILRDETEAAGGVYVDLFPLMESQARAGRVASDGLHPSADAYDAWAAEIARLGQGPCRDP